MERMQYHLCLRKKMSSGTLILSFIPHSFVDVSYTTDTQYDIFFLKDSQSLLFLIIPNQFLHSEIHSQGICSCRTKSFKMIVGHYHRKWNVFDFLKPFCPVFNLILLVFCDFTKLRIFDRTIFRLILHKYNLK